jgi:chemotaxis protein CheD
MARNLHPVPIGEMMISTDPDDVFVVYGLGSCAVVCLYDPLLQVGGILHALLPGSTWGRNANGKPTKYINQGVPLLIESLVAEGVELTRLEAKLCGGAQVVPQARINASVNMGDRNVQAARIALQSAGLQLKAEAIGGDIGRTVKFYIANGQITIKTLGQTEQLLV